MNNDNLDNIRDLVNECMFTNNTEFLAHLIYNLQTEYKEIAELATYGEYKANWTHAETLNHITYEC